MNLKELAKKYYDTREGNTSQLIIDYLGDVKKVPEDIIEEEYAKAYRSFETYLSYFKKQDILIEKGIDPKKHREYRLTKQLYDLS